LREKQEQGICSVVDWFLEIVKSLNIIIVFENGNPWKENLIFTYICTCTFLFYYMHSTQYTQVCREMANFMRFCVWVIDYSHMCIISTFSGGEVDEWILGLSFEQKSISPSFKFSLDSVHIIEAEAHAQT
jgi:hypothetical protein